MKQVRGLTRFLYDFVVGDDPLIAIVIVGALAATAGLEDAGVAAWWLLPAAAIAALALSLGRATRR